MPHSGPYGEPWGTTRAPLRDSSASPPKEAIFNRQTEGDCMDPPETRYAKSGDLNIAYQVTGGGPLDLVFVPGFVSNLDLVWEKPGLGPFLHAAVRVLAADYVR